MKSILFTYYPLFVKFNYAIALLTAICKQVGIKADYCPCTELHSKMTDFDIIGFSFVIYDDYEKCIPFIRMVKEAGKKVIAGGGYAKKNGKIKEVDCICRGEAEDFIVEYLQGNEKAFIPEYIRPSIDSLPMPDLSHVTGFEFHRGQSFLKGKKIIPYQSSRGCFYGQCVFCEVQYQPDFGKKVRIKHTIADDINWLLKTHNPDLICLFDTTIPYPFDEWKEQFKGIYMPFQGYIRADINPNDLEFLIRHGLKATAFGVESPHEGYRNGVLRKGLTDRQLLETVSILKKHNVNYVTFFIQQNPLDQNAIMRMSGVIGGYPMVWKYEDLGRNIGARL